MMHRISATPSELIAELGALGPLRAWSVIITIFGDAALPRGGVVSAAALSALTDRLGIKPEALRVALYRLAKDGWITRSKSGRNSFYALSGTGLAESRPASHRIYATGPKLHGPWRMVALAPVQDPARDKAQKALLAAGFLPVSAGLFLGPAADGKLPKTAFALKGDIMACPDWVRTALAPEELQQDYARLEPVLTRIGKLLGEGRIVDPLDAATLRVLVIHHWRRLLLHHADLPLDLLPKGWRGEACRKLVLDLHMALSVTADPWLDAAIGPRGDK